MGFDTEKIDQIPDIRDSKPLSIGANRTVPSFFYFLRFRTDRETNKEKIVPASGAGGCEGL